MHLVFSFIRNCRKRSSDRDLSPDLALNELDATETHLLKLNQDRIFNSEKIALCQAREVPCQSSLSSLFWTQKDFCGLEEC